MSETEKHRRRSVSRALLWKEWRQLRLLRFVGAALCLLLPPLLLAGAAAARRGWRPFGVAGDFSAQEVLVDAVPVVMITAWGVLALFVVAQSFLGDRAAGTELFLFTSPVRRRWVWRARLTASVASILTIVAAGLLIWTAGALASGGTAGVLESGKLALLLGGGALAVSIAFASGIGAVTLVPVPLTAVLIGLVLAVIPAGLVTVVGITFPYARVATISLGNLALLLFPMYVVASFRALCVGEPAGRGRYRRAALTVGGALAGVTILFLTLAPLAVRGGSHRNGWPHPSPTQALALVLDNWPDRRGWLVDTTSGRQVHNFGVAVWDGWWSSDGRYLAVASDAGPLGMRLPSARLEIYDTSRMQLIRTLTAGELLGVVHPLHATWTATHLVVAGLDEHFDPHLVLVRLSDWMPDSFEVGFALRDNDEPWTVVGPGENGRLYLAVGAAPHGHGVNRRWMLRLHPIDLERGRPSEEPLAQPAELKLEAPWGVLSNSYLDWRLSPSGRYWVQSEPANTALLRVANLVDGSVIEIDATPLGRLAWLAPETLVWVDREPHRSRLRAWDPVAGSRDLREADAARVLRIDASPDHRKLLTIEMIPSAGADRSARRVYEAETGRWTELGELEDVTLTGWWGGPDVLATWVENEGLAYHRLE